MALTLNLTPEQEATLQLRAAKEQKSIEAILLAAAVSIAERDADRQAWMTRAGAGDWTEDDERAFREVRKEHERIWPDAE